MPGLPKVTPAAPTLAPALALAVALAALAPAPAAAKDMGGRFGVGGQQNSLGQRGVSVKYWVGHLGFDLIFGGSTVDTKAEGDIVEDGENQHYEGEDTVTGLDSAMRVIFNAARAKDVNMFVGGGLGLGHVTQSFANPQADEASATEVGLELFLGAEYFLSNHFAVQAEVGVPMRLSIGEDGPALGGGAGGHPAATAEGQAFGFFVPTTWAAGFHFYF